MGDKVGGEPWGIDNVKYIHMYVCNQLKNKYLIN